MPIKKYLAECLGTFTLTFVVALSIAGSFPISTPVLAALTLGLFVYSIGHISGTHINPAVTIGLWSIKKIENRDALFYIVSQSLGALVALTVVTTVFARGAVMATPVGNSTAVGVAEMFGTFFFAFGIASVVYGKVASHVSGLVVGGSLLLGITIAALLGSSGVLNPAVAIGIESLSTMYVLGPILGSVLGMQAYKYLASH